MLLLEFSFLSAINLALIGWIIHRRGIASAEGLCMAYLGSAALADNVALLFHWLVSPDALPLGYREFALRLYPTAVEIVALLVLAAALEITDWRARSVNREMCEHELLELRDLGLAVAAVGLVLSVTALHLVGSPATSFYRTLGEFRSETLPYGGFWYRGADIAVFGFALALPSLQAKSKRLLLVLALMMSIAFFLRANKGGLEEPLIWGAIILFVYSRSFFRSVLKVKVVALAIAISLAGIGAKFWMVSQSSATQQSTFSLGGFVQEARAATAARWGDDGLYRGYCQFVNSLSENRGLFHGSRVGIYSLTSWIPRVFYRGKPDHPFRGLGFMIYSDFHSFPDETPAPMMVGSAMADNGLASLITYLFITGVFLGYYRRIATSNSSSIFMHCGYMFFVLFGGFSAEEGTLGILYTPLLAFTVISVARLILLTKDLMSLRTSASGD